MMLRIAIDGPGGAGKSTIARIVADKLGIDYVDTGAMYRALALKTIRSGFDTADEKAIAKMLDSTEIDFNGCRILLDGEDVSDSIRTPDVSMAASDVSKLGCVREKVNTLNRQLATSKNLVMDGRDIGTNVIKDAELKVYLTAEPMVRALRRANQLEDNGKEADLSEILEDIKRRDYQDSHRELDPLKQAEDAVYLDTSSMSIDEVVDYILNRV